MARLATPCRPSASANRVISAAFVAAYVLGARIWLPDPGQRAALHAGVVISLGYGHLIGAFVAPHVHRGAPAPPARSGSAHGRAAPFGLLRTATGATTTLATFAAFTGWLAAEPLIVLALLGVAAWHTAENDLALDDAYANAGRLGPLARSIDESLAALGVSFVMLAAAGMTLSTGAPASAPPARAPDLLHLAWLLRGLALLTGAVLVARERSPRCEAIGVGLIGTSVLLHASIADRFGVVFSDVFALTTGYHLVSWIVLTLNRGAFGSSGGARLLAATHVVPIGVGVLLLSVDLPIADPFRDAFFAPSPYLFWSAAHVVHTAWRRERRPAL